jgi:hypothetical protein
MIDAMKNKFLKAVGSELKGLRENLILICSRIKSLFTLEEIEVSITKQGNSITYTFTKIDHPKTL